MFANNFSSERLDLARERVRPDSHLGLKISLGSCPLMRRLRKALRLAPERYAFVQCGACCFFF